MLQHTKGSVVGSDHIRMGKNNQDAVYVYERDGIFIAVVCDGCSSGSRSEVGAQLGARLLARTVFEQIWADPRGNRPIFLEQVWSQVIGALESMVFSMTSHAPLSSSLRRDLVLDMFLFTTVVVAITPHRATFFSAGDGVVHINGGYIRLGPFENNAPPYIGYGIFDRGRYEKNRFSLIADMPTDRLDTFLIGTDGVGDLLKAWDKVLPNGTPVGVINRLWCDDRFFENPDALRRHLVLVNGGVDRRHPSHLPDDTSLVVGRRIRG